MFLLLPDGLGRPIKREAYWDNQVAQLLNVRKNLAEEYEQKELNKEREKMRKLETKLQNIYENLGNQEEDITSPDNELEITIQKIVNYEYEQYLSYEIELIQFWRFQAKNLCFSDSLIIPF
ncbi:hypothetical protein PPERSA_07035 [Pseudocohnilembus persalinus]|uniref:Uncharacterized protein n=1 Tax=Pseudocohnilembus persalinus TaxID=266149 RepID=A0A0V0QM34_PSEPJ|nr:hypothetical protein PPERSA_07035 [Pseudocohnilembus persalinus]|eukprot:KRX03207.1 hypothetical protein PPERSA_07035 [Pseudocohnilembus persalinus]